MTDNEVLFFNAHHAPIGAFASLTLGYRGAKGGLGLELASPADQNLWIGLEDADGGRMELLPFYAARPAADDRLRYEVGATDPHPVETSGPALVPFADSEIAREFGITHDAWTAGDLRFEIVSPVRPVPDPATADEADLRAALTPAVLVEMTVDNTKGTRPRRAVFGYSGTDVYSGMRTLIDERRGLRLIGQGLSTAIATADLRCEPCQGFRLGDILQALPANRRFGLGATAAFLAETPAGERASYRFAVCFFRSGRATAGLDTTYYYTQLFDDVESVACYTLAHYDRLCESAAQAEAWLSSARLSPDQRFMLAHAIRSYYGNTQLLQHDGRPLWVVNEGEYRMMNTFDLTVDQMFYELRMNPWTVPNVLDQFTRRYSYHDQVRFPNDKTLYPGGLSFTHDMGVANVFFSPPGYSSYEKAGIDGCFSYMTQEQLANWICCAGVYVHQTGDTAWRDANLAVLRECLDSMVNRDHPDSERRNGIMSLDTSRVEGGAEITTYDSLDTSLGQARSNIYLAGKCWAAYVLMEKLFAGVGDTDRAALARAQAERCAVTLTANADTDGALPAVLAENRPDGTRVEAVASRIVPAIEGLVFPVFAGCPEAVAAGGPYAKYITALRRHFRSVLISGICLFDDGGWKLSSTADNSWLSKIYLCQFVARKILGVDNPAVTEDADKAHVQWLMHEKESYWAWSDQIFAGVAGGSKYYPRGVTAIVWLEESPETSGALGKRLLPD
jgi:hypothetical protein